VYLHLAGLPSGTIAGGLDPFPNVKSLRKRSGLDAMLRSPAYVRTRDVQFPGMEVKARRRAFILADPADSGGGIAIGQEPQVTTPSEW